MERDSFAEVGGLNDWVRFMLDSALIFRYESCDVFEDSAGTQIPLYIYKVGNCERVYVERAQDQCLVQPITFLKLVDVNGNDIPESLWSEESIRAVKEEIADI